MAICLHYYIYLLPIIINLISQNSKNYNIYYVNVNNTNSNIYYFLLDVRRILYIILKQM